MGRSKGSQRLCRANACRKDWAGKEAGGRDSWKGGGKTQHKELLDMGPVLTPHPPGKKGSRDQA